MKVFAPGRRSHDQAKSKQDMFTCTLDNVCHGIVLVMHYNPRCSFDCLACLCHPAGQDSSAGKLSAAAFISRAHAAALAASAQRRGQRTVSGNSAGVYGSPGFSSFGSPAAPNSFGGDLYAGSPSTAHSLAGAGGSSADADALAGHWQVKRPRASSSGIPEAASGASLEQFSSLPVQPEGGMGSCGPCGKISASEQLRLTHSALRASATGGGGGVGQHGAGGSLSTSNSGVAGHFGRHSSTSGGPAAGAAAEAGDGQMSGLAAQHQALAKRRVSNHRRFASLGAMH